MTLDLSDIGGNPFQQLDADERQEAMQAIHYAECIEASHREATRLAEDAAALESAMHARSIDNPTVLHGVHEAVIATSASRAQLAVQLDDYRALLHGNGRVAGLVGLYVQWLKRARTGDTEALESLRVARNELHGAHGLIVADAYHSATTPDQREAAISAYPQLREAFALETGMSAIARGFFSDRTYKAFMRRIRDHIAADLIRDISAPATGVSPTVIPHTDSYRGVGLDRTTLHAKGGHE
jgi:hypothetical protein